MSDRNCQYCKGEIPISVHSYTMKIQMYPSVEDSLQITEADLKKDPLEEMMLIIKSMEAMDEQEVRIQEDRIYSTFSFMICRKCRDRLSSEFRDTEGQS